MIYREMMAVNNLHQEYNRQHQRQLIINHEHSQSATDRKERHIQEKTKYIEKRGSLFSPDSSKELHNFVTKEIILEKIKKGFFGNPR